MLRASIHLPPLPRVFHGLRRTQHQSSSRVLPCRSSGKPLVSLCRWRASFASPSSAGRSPLFGLAPLSPESSNSRGRVRFSSAGGEEGSGKERLVQHLLVKEEEVELLAELQKQIAQGIDLSDLAVEFSICPSKENGGMLGWIRRGQMVPEFEEAAFGAPLNKVVRCKSEFGWHLVQVISEREGSLLRDIDPEELHSKMENPDFFEESQLIDVREPDEVAIASLPGFKVLPLRQFGKWGPDIASDFDPLKDTYVLCHHGVRSLQVAQWLQTQGFRSVFNVAGGIHAYALMADPSIPTY